MTQNRRLRTVGRFENKSIRYGEERPHFHDATWIPTSLSGFRAPLGAYFCSAENPDSLRHSRHLARTAFFLALTSGRVLFSPLIRRL